MLESEVDPIARLAGVEVGCDPDLPPWRAELRREDGTVVQVFELGEEDKP